MFSLHGRTNFVIGFRSVGHPLQRFTVSSPITSQGSSVHNVRAVVRGAVACAAENYRDLCAEIDGRVSLGLVGGVVWKVRITEVFCSSPSSTDPANSKMEIAFFRFF